MTKAGSASSTRRARYDLDQQGAASEATDALILRLASDVSAVAPRAIERRIGLGLMVGTIVALALLLLTLGIRPDLLQVINAGMFWLKVGSIAALGLALFTLAIQLARPDCIKLRSPWLPLVPAGAMIMLAALEASGRTSMPQPSPLSSGWSCLPPLVLLALPIYVGLAMVFRGLAPTRLRLAGAVTGLFAGAIGGVVYSLYCHELSPTFVATRYLLAMIGVGALGAATGPLLLRWR